MSAIDRYVFRQLTAVLLFVGTTLLAAIWLTQSLRFIELIVNRGLELTSFLRLTLLLLPTFLTVILPIALFTAILFTYNKLTTDSELVVLRALGLGPRRLARPALLLAMLVMAVGYSLTLYFLPLSYRVFKDMEFDFRNDYSSILLREGTFNTVSDGVTVYVRSRDSSGEMSGLILHDARVRDRPVTMMAERGMLAFTDEGPRVIMVKGNRQQVEREDGRLSILYFERYSVDLGKVSQAQANRWREPRERFLHELLFPQGGWAEDIVYAPRLRAEAHNRLVSPLYAVAFAMIGLAALLSGEYNRRGQIGRLLAAITLVAMLQAGAIGLNNLLVKSPALTPAAYLLPIGAIVLGLWWLGRGPRRRRATGPLLAPAG